MNNIQEEYWKKRCEAAEHLIAIMERPRNNGADVYNYHFLEYRERNAAWEKSMHNKPDENAVVQGNDERVKKLEAVLREYRDKVKQLEAEVALWKDGDIDKLINQLPK